MYSLLLCILLYTGFLQWCSHASPFYRPLMHRVRNSHLAKQLSSAKKNFASKKNALKSNKLQHQVQGKFNCIEDQEFVDRLDEENEQAVQIVQSLLQPSNEWESVGETDGVQVQKRVLRAASFVNHEDAESGMKHICIKSSAVLRASADDVFNLFIDNSRVKEYNEHCESIRDVLHVPTKSKLMHTKLSWALSPKYGIFKARHFFTVVHFRKSPKQLMIINRPAYLKSFDPPVSDSIRGTVLIAGNIIAPIDEHSCRLTLIAQVNPGGSADSSAAAWLINKLVAKGPPAFVRKLEVAAMSSQLKVKGSN